LTLKGVERETLSGFCVSVYRYPRVVASSNPGLTLANAFGVSILEIAVKKSF